MQANFIRDAYQTPVEVIPHPQTGAPIIFPTNTHIIGKVSLDEIRMPLPNHPPRVVSTALGHKFYIDITSWDISNYLTLWDLP